MLIPEFFNENLVRGKGLFARALITAQQQSPTFTPVYAALLSIVNTKVYALKISACVAWVQECCSMYEAYQTSQCAKKQIEKKQTVGVKPIYMYFYNKHLCCFVSSYWWYSCRKMANLFWSVWFWISDVDISEAIKYCVLQACDSLRI